MTETEEFLDYLTDPIKYNVFKSFHEIGEEIDYVIKIKQHEKPSDTHNARHWALIFEVDDYDALEEEEEFFESVTTRIFNKHNNVIHYNLMGSVHDLDDEIKIYASLLVEGST